MTDYTAVMQKHLRPHLDAIKDDIDARRDPDYFPYSGTQVYVGMQGQGKTISAVRDVLRIKARYPKCKVVTNINLDVPWKDEIIFFQTAEELAKALTEVNNDKLGVVYIIDEIHSYFNSLGSTSIPPWVFQRVSQQRKERKVIIGTSQLFLRLAKPFREQCSNVIKCSTSFGLLTRCVCYDGPTLKLDSDGNIMGDVRPKRVIYFFQSRALRNAYDTFQTISSGLLQFQDYQEMSAVLKVPKGSKVPKQK